jgi:Ni2+-binding GTPase involved in maturation of urease and hydrogenase
MKVKLNKIPSVVRRLDLSNEVEVGDTIVAEEGAVIVVEALQHTGTNNVLDFANGRLGRLVEGDLIPAVLGKRRAMKEYSGDIPAEVKVGDILYLLCESGVCGEIAGINESWGQPLKVKVVGAVTQDGAPVNIKDVAIERQTTLPSSAPIIAVVGTAMDSGKTTTICKLVQHFRSQGKKVAAAKVAGVAFTQDPYKIRDAGAEPVMDFVDGGLPSTCGDTQEVIQVALGVLTELNKHQPDVIIVEFGDGIIGEYNVPHLLQHPEIQQHIRATIVSASDLVAAWGAKQIMAQYGVPVTVLTGPAVNNDTGVRFIEEHIGIPAESNLHEITKIIELVEARVFSNRLFALPLGPRRNGVGSYTLAATG